MDLQLWAFIFPNQVMAFNILVSNRLCFHVARAVIKSVQSFSLSKLQSQTETKSADPEGYPLFPMLSQGLPTGKRPFQDGAMFALLQGTSSTSSEGQQSCS